MPEFYKSSGLTPDNESDADKIVGRFKRESSKYMSDQDLTDLAAGIILEYKDTLGPEDADLIQSLVVSVIGLPKIG